MKPEDIREWDDTEIETRVGELEEERFRLKFQASMMELENPNLIGGIRRDIARLKTILRERKLTGSTAVDE